MANTESETVAGSELLLPFERETLEKKVYHTLRAALLEGHFANGQHLVQDALASKIGVSRIPVRNALKQLAIDGLVTVNGRGSYFAQQFTVDDAREVYGLRALLEPYAARLAIARMTPGDVDELEGVAKLMFDAARRRERERYVALNRSFHMRLYELCSCRRLLLFIESLWSGMPPLTLILIDDQLDRSVSEHEELLEAIHSGDADRVAERLREHIEHAGKALSIRLKGNKPR